MESKSSAAVDSINQLIELLFHHRSCALVKERKKRKKGAYDGTAGWMRLLRATTE